MSSRGRGYCDGTDIVHPERRIICYAKVKAQSIRFQGLELINDLSSVIFFVRCRKHSNLELSYLIGTIVLLLSKRQMPSLCKESIMM